MLMVNPLLGLYHIRAFGYSCYLLVDGDEAVLIDTGMWGSVRKIEALLELLDFEWLNLKAILLTHGHIDHACNAHTIASLSECKVYIHRLEHAHLRGEYHYSKANRWCARGEALLRRFTHYTPATPDIYFQDQDHLPFWGGLRVIHLPGHTTGHCGFYSEKHDILFAGDLFTYFLRPSLPPRSFCTAPWFLRESFDKVAALDPSGILCAHSWHPNPEQTRKGFDSLYRRICRGSICLPENK